MILNDLSNVIIPIDVTLTETDKPSTTGVDSSLSISSRSSKRKPFRRAISMRPFNVVVAVSNRGGVGINGQQLPWTLKGDIDRFREVTTHYTENGNHFSFHTPPQQNAVIMGRRTWLSLPKTFQPLPGRFNVVVARQPVAGECKAAGICHQCSVLRVGSLQEALEACFGRETVDSVFVIGGGALYREALQSPWCRRIFMTFVASDPECDTVFEQVGEEWETVEESAVLEEDGLAYRFLVWERAVAMTTVD